MASWREGDVGAFSVSVTPPPTLGPTIDAQPFERFQVTPVDRCVNLECPNRAHEGRMTILSVHARALAGAKRDVALLLCAPCAEYLSRVLR